jgi:hypothetical protein
MSAQIDFQFLFWNFLLKDLQIQNKLDSQIDHIFCEFETMVPLHFGSIFQIKVRN